MSNSSLVRTGGMCVFEIVCLVYSQRVARLGLMVEVVCPGIRTTATLCWCVDSPILNLGGGGQVAVAPETTQPFADGCALF